MQFYPSPDNWQLAEQLSVTQIANLIAELDHYKRLNDERIATANRYLDLYRKTKAELDDLTAQPDELRGIANERRTNLLLNVGPNMLSRKYVGCMAEKEGVNYAKVVSVSLDELFTLDNIYCSRVQHLLRYIKNGYRLLPWKTDKTCFMCGSEEAPKQLQSIHSKGFVEWLTLGSWYGDQSLFNFSPGWRFIRPVDRRGYQWP